MKTRNKTLLVLVTLSFLTYLSLKDRNSEVQPGNVRTAGPPAASEPVDNLEPTAKSPATVRQPQATSVQAKEVSSAELAPISEKEVEELRSKTRSFLAALYMSQKAFHAEYGQYVTDVIALGLTPEPVLPFKAGFLESSPEPSELRAEANVNVRRLNTDALMGERESSTNEPYQYAPLVGEIDLSSYREFCRHGCTADDKSFEMLIATPLGNSEQVDVWLVNENKELLLVKEGTKSRVE